ncbi:hypothetical protein [Jannaschia aquimarina]|uniref:Uncharacterized protein n=1 Tax=Jannaschia aquimarina TaxID=935700 RepID=A0A0D1D6E3_9RHOB|nr:hypothetical protein [Jannaschia aquimarina]KIT15568.1 hypothetical protein jaqu_26650 [Jannaschia aquimarina]SNT27065.1 hypothetical protein SAMN05421775_109119 [Jannaschia aquimarina]
MNDEYWNEWRRSGELLWIIADKTHAVVFWTGLSAVCLSIPHAQQKLPLMMGGLLAGGLAVCAVAGLVLPWSIDAITEKGRRSGPLVAIALPTFLFLIAIGAGVATWAIVGSIEASVIEALRQQE